MPPDMRAKMLPTVAQLTNSSRVVAQLLSQTLPKKISPK